MKKIFQSLFTGILILLVHSIQAQDGEMFMFQVEGKSYERNSYSKNDELLGIQKFTLGKIGAKQNQFVLPIDVKVYDASKKLQEEYNTTYKCNPESNEVLMNVLPFASFSADKKITVSSKEKFHLYPSNWEIEQTLPDIHFSLEIEGGAIGFFDGTSKATIFNRQLVKRSTKTGSYLLKSAIKVEMYLFSIKVKTILFNVREWVHPEKGLISQKFTNQDGSYFTIHLLK